MERWICKTFLILTLPAVDSEENHACVLTAGDDSRDELLLNKEGSPNNTFLFQKYTSGEFIDKDGREQRLILLIAPGPNCW